MDTLEDALANSNYQHRKKTRGKNAVYGPEGLAHGSRLRHDGRKKRQKTEGEEHFYHPAVRRALAYLTPAINSDPQRAVGTAQFKMPGVNWNPCCVSSQRAVAECAQYPLKSAETTPKPYRKAQPGVSEGTQFL